MPAPYQGLYEGLTFPEYEFKEYPKFIQTGEKVDLATKTKTPTGVLVNNAEEEAEATKTGAAPVREEDEKARLLALAELKNVKLDKRWRVDRMESVLTEAGVDTDHDPDA